MTKRRGSTIGNSTSVPLIPQEHKYSLEDFKKTIGFNLTDKEALDLLFYCPFKFPDTKTYKKRDVIDKKYLRLSSFARQKVNQKYSVNNLAKQVPPLNIDKKSLKRLQPIKNNDLRIEIESLSAESIQSQETVSDDTQRILERSPGSTSSESSMADNNDDSPEKRIDLIDFTQRSLNKPGIQIFPSTTFQEKEAQRSNSKNTLVDRDIGSDQIQILDLSDKSLDEPKDDYRPLEKKKDHKLKIPARKKKIILKNKAATKRLSEVELLQYKNTESQDATTSEAAQTLTNIKSAKYIIKNRSRFYSNEFSSDGPKTTTIGKRRKIHVNTALTIKDPYIKSRTKLTLQQAKLMSSLNQHKLNKKKLTHMLSHVPSTRKRKTITQLLNPTKMLAALGEAQCEQSKRDLEVEQSGTIDMSKEIVKIMKDYMGVGVEVGWGSWK